MWRSNVPWDLFEAITRQCRRGDLSEFGELEFRINRPECGGLEATLRRERCPFTHDEYLRWQWAYKWLTTQTQAKVA
ncbi:hypothetical protein KW786_02465 [Candidatus Parcubacteria bacterium]|nr:hypothetical protein [Candidatus Parcubacteria bacterium]